MTAYESTTSRLVQQELEACVLIQDLLPLYAEGEVSPGSRELIAEHVARCERCAGYLAGTHSALAQLRRARTAHIATLAHDVPNQKVMAGGQRLVAAIALLTTYGGGLVASVLIGQTTSGRGNPLELVLGLGLGSISLIALFALARTRGLLTLQRVLALLGSCGVALFGSIAFVANGHGGELTLGILLWLLGLAGVWAAVLQRPAESAAAAMAPKLNNH
ncbi:MAG TPA: zf-HC2 domain-containing protein [Roseiflexaceae bacterium]|nr:zf-HC2 domain-containing protein [Roseiflexaceae bacterium]